MEDTMTLNDAPQAPQGSVISACGRILPDTGHGRLLAILDEAYELGNASVKVVSREDIAALPLTDELAEGDVEIASGIVAREADTDVVWRQSYPGIGKALVRAGEFVVILEWDDPLSLPEAADLK
jgi:hypothetical protein